MIINEGTGKLYPKNFLRDTARGRPCMVRIARECGYHGCASEETTVLAHITGMGLRGVGMKGNDLLGAWACDTCHGILDHRINVPLEYMVTNEQLALWHHQGVARTIACLIQEGVLEYRK